MVLGIDVSTSCTGFAILDYVNELVDYECAEMKNTNKFANIYEKARYIQNILKNIKQKHEHKIKNIYIEAKLMNFQKGRSSPQVLAKLSEFNGMVSLLCHQIFDIVPEHVHPSSARKLAGVKVPRGKGQAKISVMNFCIDKYPSFVLEYTPKKNIKSKYFDVADAIIIARAGVKIESSKKSNS